MKRVIVLGSTGSVGKQTLEVIAELGYKVVGLGCHKNVELLKKQLSKYGGVGGAIESNDECLYNGDDAYLQLCENVDYDVLVAAASGLSSLDAVLYALKSGKRVALANKEIAVCAGVLLKEAAKSGELIPVDSEHSAIFQCLQGRKDVKRLTLTCSGGALRDVPLDKLFESTAEDALKHPNWNMGAKITVDCATMANKAFEVIEAATLFGDYCDDIKVLIHKESLTHGFITFKDGSVLAQISRPDMKSPIRYALTYPERGEAEDFSLCGKTMTFSEPDPQRYPLFDIIVEGCKKSPASASFIAGVDEGAVGLFLKGNINYLKLHNIISAGVSSSPVGNIENAKEALAYYNAGVEFANKSLKV